MVVIYLCLKQPGGVFGVVSHKPHRVGLNGKIGPVPTQRGMRAHKMQTNLTLLTYTAPCIINIHWGLTQSMKSNLLKKNPQHCCWNFVIGMTQVAQTCKLRDTGKLCYKWLDVPHVSKPHTGKWGDLRRLQLCVTMPQTGSCSHAALANNFCHHWWHMYLC